MRALLAAAVVTLLLAGCSGSSPAASTDHQDVDVRDNNFNPSTVNVVPGQAVEFHSSGTNKHTVTIHDGAGATVLDKELSKGQATSYTFSAAGSYHVFCKLHSNAQAVGMSMTVNAK